VGRCLYDADTIDANIGLPAFVRNIYINSHFYDVRKSPDMPSLGKLLQENPLGYLRPYVLDKLPDWTRGKERDFLPRILTKTGHEIARLRLARLQETWTALADELEDSDRQRSHGRLAVILHFMNHTDDPSIAAETSYLARHWLTTNGATPEAGALLAHLEREMSGIE